MAEEAAVAQEQAESAAKAGETEQAAASAAAETSETQADQAAGEATKPPEKGGVQRRIDELTKARRLAEAEAEFWRQKALGTAGKTPEEAGGEKPKPKPNPADFETTEAYLDARDEWVKAETLRTAREEIQKAEQAQEQRSEEEIVAEEWREREASVKSEHDDYMAVTAHAMDALQAAQGPAKLALAHAMQYSEAGPEVLYYLGQHPEEIQELASLHPTQAVLALGRIEARLAPENEGGEKPPPLTRAPKPPTPIRKTAAGTTLDPDKPEDAEKMSPEDWRKAREAKLRGR